MKFNWVFKHLAGIWNFLPSQAISLPPGSSFPSEKSKIPLIYARSSPSYHSIGPTEPVRLVTGSSVSPCKGPAPWLKCFQIQALLPFSTCSIPEGRVGMEYNGKGSCCHGNLLFHEITLQMAEWYPCIANFAFIHSFTQLVQQIFIWLLIHTPTCATVRRILIFVLTERCHGGLQRFVDTNPVHNDRLSLERSGLPPFVITTQCKN